MRFYALAIGENDPDFVSRCIQEFLSERHGIPVDWSHCAIEIEGSLAHDGVWDSTGRGFEFCSKEEALEGSVARHRILLPVKNPDGALLWCMGNRGRRYSNLQYALYLLPMWAQRALGKILPKKIRNWFANGRAESVCSESLYYFMKDNCAGAENWADNGDRVDPYMVIVAAKGLEGIDA